MSDVVTTAIERKQSQMRTMPLTYSTAQAFGPSRFGLYPAARKPGRIASVASSSFGLAAPAASADIEAASDVALREGEAGPLGLSMTTWLLLGGAAVVLVLVARKGKRRR